MLNRVSALPPPYIAASLMTNYRPKTKLQKGNVFTSVCQEYCPQRGGGLSARHPLGAHPLPGRYATPTPWALCQPQCMHGYHPPRSRHPPRGRHPPGADTTPDQTPPPRSRHPPLGSRLQHTANERTVRILLQCMLVVNTSALSPKKRTRKRSKNK